MAGELIEHHRVDPTAALVRALVIGVVMVTIGGLASASSFVIPRLAPREGEVADGIVNAGEVRADGTRVERAIDPRQIALIVFGLTCILGGIGRTIFVLRGRLGDEAYLALRADGALFSDGAHESFVRWDDVERVRWDPARSAIVFARHDGSEWIRAERFADLPGEALAARAAEVRRKALFGLLQ